MNCLDREVLKTWLRIFSGLTLGALSIYLFCINTGLLNFYSDMVNLIATIIAVAIGMAGAIYILRPGLKIELYEKADLVAQILVRYFLGYIFLVYAAAKILGGQFGSPLYVLDTPLGEVSGFSLTWRFFGYSYSYAVFIALAQIAGATLLFFRRTTTLGACILLPVISNIVFINFSHDIPVKLLSVFYLIMVCYLVALDYDRLSALFIENRPLKAHYYLPLFLQPKLRKVMLYLKVGYIIFSFLYAFCFIYFLNLPYMSKSELYGAWTVVEVKVTDDLTTVQSLHLSDWKKVFFEQGDFGVVKTEDSKNTKWFKSSVSPEKRHVIMNFTDPNFSPSFNGQYKFINGRTVELRGMLGSNNVQILLSLRELGDKEK